MTEQPIASSKATPSRALPSSPPFPKAQDQHKKFVAALEKYGSELSGEEWDNMAHCLHWHVDEVKLYAYWYMHQLHYTSSTSGSTMTKNADKGLSSGGKATRKISLVGSEGNTSGTENDGGKWTYQEYILFDTLLATYGPEDTGQDNDDLQTTTGRTCVQETSSMRWKKISAMIPNKTPSQCCDKYYELYG